MRTAVRVVVGLACVLVSGVTTDAQGGPADSIANSHIEANVPSPGDFDLVLHRDLEAYFASKTAGGRVTVRYELLRQGATQSGVANPKFYAWVEVHERGQLIREGAVRLAAVERERFEVIDFLSMEEIRRSPEAIKRVFPAPVCDRIQAKVTLGKRSAVQPDPRLQRTAPRAAAEPPRR